MLGMREDMKEKSVIALVDDERNILTSLGIALEAEGYKVRTYSDGAAALEALTEEPADLAILDIKMPRMDGLEVLQRIRADERLRRMPVVILSSSREESDLVRSWNLGVNAYVVKPVDIDQFFAAVKTLGKFWAVINETPVGEG